MQGLEWFFSVIFSYFFKFIKIEIIDYRLDALDLIVWWDESTYKICDTYKKKIFLLKKTGKLILTRLSLPPSSFWVVYSTHYSN